MRSRWVGRLFGQADGGAGLGKAQRMAPAVSKAAKHASMRDAGAMPARPRICLGIGDGSVHRQ